MFSFKNCVLVLTLLAASVASQAATAPKGAASAPAPAKPPHAIINLHHCPISHEEVANNGKGGVVVDNYRVQFCCGGCPEEFAKMTLAEKRAAIATLVKLEKPAPGATVSH